MSKPQYGYAVHCGPSDDEGRVILVERGVSGYRPIEEYDDIPARSRPFVVKRLNERIGTTGSQASQLVAQSMMSKPCSLCNDTKKVFGSRGGVGCLCDCHKCGPEVGEYSDGPVYTAPSKEGS